MELVGEDKLITAYGQGQNGLIRSIDRCPLWRI